MSQEEAVNPLADVSLDEVNRREAMKQGLAAVAAGTLAFSAPKIEGLAIVPKQGAALSQIKKRRRCKSGRMRFRLQAGARHQLHKDRIGSRYYNGDPEGVCSYKGGLRGHRDDFKRFDIPQNSATGTIEGDILPINFIVAENTGSACPVVVSFNNPGIRFSKLSFVLANNCRIPEEAYYQNIASSGACEIPLLWTTPSHQTGTRTCSFSASFEEEEKAAPEPTPGPGSDPIGDSGGFFGGSGK